jgi:hypothetical protein
VEKAWKEKMTAGGDVLKTSRTPPYDDSSHRSRVTRASLPSGTPIAGRTTSNPAAPNPVRIAADAVIP